MWRIFEIEAQDYKEISEGRRWLTEVIGEDDEPYPVGTIFVMKKGSTYEGETEPPIVAKVRFAKHDLVSEYAIYSLSPCSIDLFGNLR